MGGLLSPSSEVRNWAGQPSWLGRRGQRLLVSKTNNYYEFLWSNPASKAAIAAASRVRDMDGIPQMIIPSIDGGSTRGLGNMDGIGGQASDPNDPSTWLEPAGDLWVRNDPQTEMCDSFPYDPDVFVAGTACWDGRAQTCWYQQVDKEVTGRQASQAINRCARAHERAHREIVNENGSCVGQENGELPDAKIYPTSKRREDEAKLRRRNIKCLLRSWSCMGTPAQLRKCRGAMKKAICRNCANIKKIGELSYAPPACYTFGCF